MFTLALEKLHPYRSNTAIFYLNVIMAMFSRRTQTQTHKKKTLIGVCVDVDWKLNSRHKNWVCPFRREKKCVDSNHKSYTIKSHMHMPCQICCFASKDLPTHFSFFLALLWVVNVLIMKVTCFNFTHSHNSCGSRFPNGFKQQIMNRTYVWLKNGSHVQNWQNKTHFQSEPKHLHVVAEHKRNPQIEMDINYARTEW